MTRCACRSSLATSSAIRWNWSAWASIACETLRADEVFQVATGPGRRVSLVALSGCAAGNLPRRYAVRGSRTSGEVAHGWPEARIVTADRCGWSGQDPSRPPGGRRGLTEFPAARGCGVRPICDPSLSLRFAAALGVKALPGVALLESLVGSCGPKRSCWCSTTASTCSRRSVGGCARGAGPGLSVLATSREGLGIAGERIVAVTALACHPAGALGSRCRIGLGRAC